MSIFVEGHEDQNFYNAALKKARQTPRYRELSSIIHGRSNNIRTDCWVAIIERQSIELDAIRETINNMLSDYKKTLLLFITKTKQSSSCYDFLMEAIYIENAFIQLNKFTNFLYQWLVKTFSNVYPQVIAGLVIIWIEHIVKLMT